MLDRLLVKLTTSAIADAGAQRGCLILDNDRHLEIVATVESQTISILPAIAFDSEVGRGLVSLAIVNYVADTQENIIIDCTHQDSLFNQDTYILDVVWIQIKKAAGSSISINKTRLCIGRSIERNSIYNK